MSPQVSIRLDHRRTSFRPGERISGHVILSHHERWNVDYADLALTWRTEGRGDEDHEAVEMIALMKKGESAPSQTEIAFSVTAAQMPWTYHGINIKIHWTVGAFIKEKGEKEVSAEIPIVIHPVPDRFNSLPQGEP